MSAGGRGGDGEGEGGGGRRGRGWGGAKMLKHLAGSVQESKLHLIVRSRQLEG